MTRKRVIFGIVILACGACAIAAWRLVPRTNHFYSDSETIRQPKNEVVPRDVLWQPPTRLFASGINTDLMEYEPRFSWDGLTLFFVRGKTGENADILYSTKSIEGWSEPTALSAVNTEADELGPEPSADGRALYFYSDRSGGVGGYDIWVTYQCDGEWAAPENLGSAINTSFNEYSPAVSPDGTQLYFSSNRPRPGALDGITQDTWSATIRENIERFDYDLFVATLAAGVEAEVVRLSALNSAQNDGSPAVSPAGDFLYFASNRPGGAGGFDLYRSRRLQGKHTAPVALDAPVNTPANELDPGLTSLGFALVFSSDRVSPATIGGDKRDYDLFVTTSREVFSDSETLARATIDWPWWWGVMWPPLLAAMLASLLAWLLWRLLGDLRRRQLGLLARCLLFSLFAHLVILFLLTFWGVAANLGLLPQRGGAPIHVTLSDPGDVKSADSIEHQIRGDVTGANRPMPVQHEIAFDSPTIHPSMQQVEQVAVDAHHSEIKLMIERSMDMGAEPSNSRMLQHEPETRMVRDSITPTTNVRLPELEAPVARNEVQTAPPTSQPVHVQAELASVARAELARQELAPTNHEARSAADVASSAPMQSIAASEVRRLNAPSAEMAEVRLVSTQPLEITPQLPAIATPRVQPQSAVTESSFAPRPQAVANNIETDVSLKTALVSSNNVTPQRTMLGAHERQPEVTISSAIRKAPSPARTIMNVDTRQPEVVRVQQSPSLALNLPATAESRVNDSAPDHEPKPTPVVQPTALATEPVRIIANTTERVARDSTSLNERKLDATSPRELNVETSAIRKTPTALREMPVLVLPTPPIEITSSVPLRLPVIDIPAPEEAYAQRAPEKREQILERMGGDEETEKAVASALVWLAKHQSEDGRWDADRFDQACGKCGGETTYQVDVALTGLSLLCFLGADHTHKKDGPYRENVDRGLRWLTSQVRADGDMRGNETMYSQGIATIALAEALGMTRDPRLVDPVRRSLRFIENARNRRVGGWRYDPGQVGDTSVLGWQVMAMKSAQRAGLDVSPSSFAAVEAWVDMVASKNNPGLYSYQPGRDVSPAMTAESMFIRQLLGAQRSESRMAASANYLLKSPPNWNSGPNTYYWYYATLAMFQHQGAEWEAWNGALKRELLDHQRQDDAGGSWDPVGEWADVGGRVYQTALCTLMLEVYYRYLPMYKLADATPKEAPVVAQGDTGQTSAATGP